MARDRDKKAYSDLTYVGNKHINFPLTRSHKNIAPDNSVFSICINSTSTKYGLTDMEHFENLVRLPDMETQWKRNRSRDIWKYSQIGFTNGVCVICFQTLFPRKRGFLHETGFSLPHRSIPHWWSKRGKCSSISTSKIPTWTWLLAQATQAGHVRTQNLSVSKPGGFAAVKWKYSYILIYHKPHKTR